MSRRFPVSEPPGDVGGLQHWTLVPDSFGSTEVLDATLLPLIYDTINVMLEFDRMLIIVTVYSANSYRLHL